MLDEEREDVSGLRVRQVDVRIPAADVHVEDAVVPLGKLDRPTEQEVTYGLRVLPRLGPAVGSPSVVRGLSLRARWVGDVEPRPVGDDRLERDQPPVRGRLFDKVLEAA